MKSMTWCLALLILSSSAGAEQLPVVEKNSTAPIGQIGKPGQPIDVKPYAVPGKTTVFDFNSPYCGPCRRMAAELEKIVKRRHDIVVRSILIDRPGSKGIDFGSPIAEQYKLQGIPYFIIYDGKGKQVADGDKAYEMILTWAKQK